VDQYLTKTEAQKAAEGLRLTLNNDYIPTGAARVGTLVDRYMLEAMPQAALLFSGIRNQFVLATTAVSNPKSRPPDAPKRTLFAR